MSIQKLSEEDRQLALRRAETYYAERTLMAASRRGVWGGLKVGVFIGTIIGAGLVLALKKFGYI